MFGFGKPVRIGLAVGVVVICLTPASVVEAAEVLPPVSLRFSSSQVQETPDFQRHVVPLLGRLGCNGRSCHGSFQGQGGLRLSLFGYDFDMDHQALTAASPDSGESRVVRSQPDESLILRKPLLQSDHEGGERITVGSWEHHLLRRWIESGASGADARVTPAALRVEPSEIVFRPGAPPARLSVIVEWENGESEDVTPLCRFRSNDDSIAEVSPDGTVTSAGPGDTHVIVFYDNGIEAVPVLRPFTRSSDSAGNTRTPSESSDHSGRKPGIDFFVRQKLQKLNLRSSEICSDTVFLRRVSLDLTGTLPTPNEVHRFTADPDPEKRIRKIDELLQRPAYAAWWANKLCDFTGCNPAQQAELGQETSVQWYMWIYARLLENIPYDDLVRRIVLARSRQSETAYEDYAAATSAYFRDQNPSDFTVRETMPHYWTRRSMQQPDEAAQAFAHNFLGIRLQCAQCHKHPFAPWTQDDFRNFSGFFEGMKFGVPEESRGQYRLLAERTGLRVRDDDGSSVTNDVLRQARRGRTVPWRELYFSGTESPRTLDLLRSGDVTLSSNDDPREPIMKWMMQADNPWFARAFVNRAWAACFHRGLVEPPDDLNPANPPSHPKLLQYLTEQFVAHDMDIKWLLRTIVSSETYQRSWVPGESNASDRRNYSRAVPRRMPAEVVYDTVKQALAADEMSDEVRTDLTRRAIGHLSMRLAGTYAMQVFGKPERAVNCDCERVNQPTLLQAVFLQNDPLMDDRLNGSGWLKNLEQMQAENRLPSNAVLIREAWLRTVSREPSATESARAARHLEEAESPVAGLRDLLWALLNTSEFILIQ